MSNFPVPPAVPEAPKGPNGFYLFARVFDEPAMVFKEITQEARVGAALLILIVAFAVRAFAIPDAVLQKDTAKGLDAAAKFAPNAFTPEIRQKALDKAVSLTSRAQSAVFGGLGIIAVTLIVTLVLWGVFSMAGGEIGFKQEWSIVLYGGGPMLLGMLVVLALSPVTQSSTFSIGLGFAVSNDTSPFVHALLAQITIFSVWQIYLLAMGNQVVRKVKTIGGSLAIVGTMWFIAALIGSAVAAKFGGLPS